MNWSGVLATWESLRALGFGRISFKIKEEVVITVFTAIISSAFNIAAGFIAGLLVYVELTKRMMKKA